MDYDICPGEGPEPCDVFFVAEHPGWEEMKEGRPAVGRTSSEFNRYLDGYLLPERHRVYITHLIKTPPAGKGISDAEIERDAPLLEDELEKVQPKVLVTLGRHSTRRFLGDVDLETVHGIPHHPQPDGPTVFPCYSYLAGLHAPELASKYDYDMNRLGLLLKGKLPPKPEDTLQTRYQECRAFSAMKTVGVDTEGWVHNPWCWSASDVPGTGWVGRPGSVFDFGDDTLFVLHNSLHDLTVLRAMGIVPKKYTDTMVMAYLLGLEPQGLKPLAYRHAGMLQDDYADLTREAGERIAREWLEQQLKDFEWMRCPGPKPPAIEKTWRLVERMLKKDPGESRPLRERWADCAAREVLEDELELLGPMPEPTLDDVPLEKAIHYAARDADATLRIFPVLDQQIDAMGLRDALTADLNALPMIDRMQTVGIRVDVDYFRDLSPFFQSEWETYQAKLDAMVGHELNVNSGDQVAEYLFDRLHLPPGKKTKGGRPSTNDKILEALRKDPRTHEQGKAAIDLIQEVREIRKLKSAFCDKMPDYVRADGRIHPNFRVTRVATGRLAASDPNLLAFPKHSARGKLIRGGFVAAEGRVLGEWDLDQIEMRVMAIDANDERMIAEFLSGVDKHTATASMIFSKPIEEIDKEIERFAAKAVNFGILMGITEHGLLDQFKKNGSYRGKEQKYNRITEDWEDRRVEWDETACKKLLTDWHKAYPDASRYMSDKHAEARRYGFVRDMFGRLRYIPGVRSYDKFTRAAAERDAQSTPIQSGAQGIAKRWAAEIWKRLPGLWEKGIYCEPLLQIHDAYILELSEEHYTEVDAMMQDALAQLQWFPVPITCKGKSGPRWSDL